MDGIGSWDEWMHGWMDARMDGRMDARMDGRMDGWDGIRCDGMGWDGLSGVMWVIWGVI